MDEFQVIVDPELGREVGGVVAFGDFELKPDSIGAVYPLDTALTSFYEDMLRGRSFPRVLVIRGIQTVGQLLIVAMFLHRDLVLNPRMPGLVASVNMVDRYGLVGMAHIDDELGRFFQLMTGYLPPSLKRKQQQKRLTAAVEWICDYVVSGALPALPPRLVAPRVINTGTGGFVVAEANSRSLTDAWVWLYRSGALWGLVFSQPAQGHRRVLGGRKSTFIPLDMPRLAASFNQAEAAMGMPADWQADELWLHGPSGGTLLPIADVVQVFIHD